MTPNFLKQLLHALCRMDYITFWSTPEVKWFCYFLLNKTNLQNNQEIYWQMEQTNINSSIIPKWITYALRSMLNAQSAVTGKVKAWWLADQLQPIYKAIIWLVDLNSYSFDQHALITIIDRCWLILSNRLKSMSKVSDLQQKHAKDYKHASIKEI